MKSPTRFPEDPNFESGDDDVVLENITITGGYVTGTYPEGYGGGILVLGGSPTITNCYIENCQAPEHNGGGVYINSNASFTNCFFDSCTAATGGAAGIGGSSPAFTECHFTNNVGTNNAGGVFTVAFSPTFENCEFLNNNTYNGSGGGVFCGQASEVTLNTCTFNNNSALQLGGGMPPKSGRRGQDSVVCLLLFLTAPFFSSCHHYCLGDDFRSGIESSEVDAGCRSGGPLDVVDSSILLLPHQHFYLPPSDIVDAQLHLRCFRQCVLNCR